MRTSRSFTTALVGLLGAQVETRRLLFNHAAGQQKQARRQVLRALRRGYRGQQRHLIRVGARVLLPENHTRRTNAYTLPDLHQERLAARGGR